MRRTAAFVLALVTSVGCGPSLTSRPAADGVRELVAALKRDDPRAAYALLSAETRRRVSYDQFAAEWKQQATERAWQVRALEDSLRGDPDVGERAQVSYRDGRTIDLDRDGATWHLDAALLGRTRAARPRDAIRALATALHRKDLDGALTLLTQRRRDGIAKQVAGFVAGIDKRIDGKIEELGTDRAELRWDENGIRFRIVLRKEDGEWRIDDIHIRPTPTDEEPAADADSSHGFDD
jgi:hypothetical protein